MQLITRIFNKTTLFVLFLFVVLFEGGSYAVLTVLKLQGKHFADIYDPSGNTARVRGKCDDYVQTLELHPYLAFVHGKRCSSTGYKTNNIGLLNQDVDLTNKQFHSVGIFGGSVAAQFGGLDTTPQLEQILNGCFQNKKTKPFKVLNFADGAWKQPQQVIALALYGDYLDVAISIEGFNEHYTVGASLDMTIPAGTFASLINNNFFSNTYFKLRHINGTFLDKSNFIKLLTVAYRRTLEKRGIENNNRINQNFLLPHEVDHNTHNSNRYLGFIKSFDAIADSKHIYSMVVLQPSPLHKKLSAVEATQVGSLDYEKQYQEISRILSNARHFLDLTDLFKNSDQTIFSDRIHFVGDDRFRSYGNYKMALEIVNKLSHDGQITPAGNLATCIAKFASTQKVEK